jgi:dTDP-4-dehydrorhamnose reductase
LTEALLVGGDGALARALAEQLDASSVSYLATSRRPPPGQPALDLAELGRGNPSAAESLAEMVRPSSVVVILAAMTTFAACRENPELAELVNTAAPLVVGRVAREQGAKVVLVSTAAVFGGNRPYALAGSPTDGTSRYGSTKAAAEKGLDSLGGDVAIVRLTKVLGPEAELYAKWRRALADGDTVTAFDDMNLAPIALPQVTHFLSGLVSDFQPGIFQLSGATQASYFDLALHLAAAAGVSPERVERRSARETGIAPEQLPQFATMAAGERETSRGFRAPAPADVVDWSLGLAPAPR